MIKGVFYLEARGNHRGVVEGSLKALVESLKKEEKLKVRKTKFEDVVQDSAGFSAAVEVELEFEGFLNYIMTAMKYCPSAIEILAPENLLLSANEFLEAIGEMIKFAKLFYETYNVGFKFSAKGKGASGIGLSEDEIAALLEQNAIHAKIIVESRGRSKKKVLDDFVNAVSDDVFVNKAKAKEIKHGEDFEGVVGIEAFMYEPKTLVDIAVRFAPVLIEILEPPQIRLSMLEIQDIGVDLAGIFFEASHKLVLGGE